MTSSHWSLVRDGSCVKRSGRLPSIPNDFWKRSGWPLDSCGWSLLSRLGWSLLHNSLRLTNNHSGSPNNLTHSRISISNISHNRLIAWESSKDRKSIANDGISSELTGSVQSLSDPISQIGINNLSDGLRCLNFFNNSNGLLDHGCKSNRSLDEVHMVSWGIDDGRLLNHRLYKLRLNGWD